MISFATKRCFAAMKPIATWKIASGVTYVSSEERSGSGDADALYSQAVVPATRALTRPCRMRASRPGKGEPPTSTHAWRVISQ